MICKIDVRMWKKGKTMRKEIGIIMAAGLGTRMRPLTEKRPKPLVKVFGKPLIETVIEGLRGRNVSDIYIVIPIILSGTIFLPFMR